jgi:hypothetical protein
MSDPRATELDRLFELMGAVCDNTASQDELIELDSMMLADPEAFRCYVDYCRMHSAFRLNLRAGRMSHKVYQQIAAASAGLDANTTNILEVETPSIAHLYFLSNTIHGTLGFFSQEVPFGFLIATLLTGLLLLSLWLTPVSHPAMQQIAGPSQSPSADSKSPAIERKMPKIEYVGRIVDTVDCKWSRNGKVGGGQWAVASESSPQSLAPNPSSYPQHLISLGDKLIVDSGLMEIVYDMGARVILQGPCTYTVESTSGGFLAVGKLTAKLEKKVGARVVSGSESNPEIPKSRNPEISASANPQPPTPNPSFFVRTPTAVVTDLGTEFGVEVDLAGQTISCVFRGLVELRTVDANGKANSNSQLLHANQSARVENIVANVDGHNRDHQSPVGLSRIVRFASSARSAEFVRDIPKQTAIRTKSLDLLAYWRFDGRGFLNDLSGHGHTLVNRGVVQTDGGALFDGNAILSTVDSIDLTPYAKVRISWSQKATSQNPVQVVLEHGENFHNTPGAFVVSRGVAVGAAAIHAASGERWDHYPTVAGPWEHFMVEYNVLTDEGDRAAYRSDIVKVFKNGELVGSVAREHIAPDSFANAAFYIGGRVECSSSDLITYGFFGLIDHVKIEGKLRPNNTIQKSSTKGGP